MTTITFYSYKGGTGRSLALANAAVYLANLGFKVVAIDFDLEAPGLHYKLLRNSDRSHLSVNKGVVDFVNTYLDEGQVSSPITDFIIRVPISESDKQSVHLVPAGRAPSPEYWSELSRINWHDLFYSEDPKGVQIFMELRARILEELKPDFLLIDSRTGITEMGGVATTILSDKVICLVLPTLENLEGARAVLRSLRRTRHENGSGPSEILIAVSRVPKNRNWHDEQESAEAVRKFVNQPAEQPADTLSCEQVFVLHSEPALQLRETLRVGSGINPDDSPLLRDYLRLFANFVPKKTIETKLHDLIEKAWNKLREDPDEAVKEMEELAESFAHPETYRELLKFYQVRNVNETQTLKRAQRLWDLTQDSSDPILWQALVRAFEPLPQARWRADKQWSPNLDFIQSVWRVAGERNAAFGMKLADAYSQEDRDSIAADIVLEVIKFSEPTAATIARCVALLDFAKRGLEADDLIQQFKTKFGVAPEFANAWARHSIRHKNKPAIEEIAQSPWIENLRPSLRAIVYANLGRMEDAASDLESVRREIRDRQVSGSELEWLGKIFNANGSWDEFEETARGMYSPDMIREIREQVGARPRRRSPSAELKL
jgi:MinD-like ATPase involved in chromosome partitioning or flagellar assembly